jgi:GT2 family glycosyltransferase
MSADVATGVVIVNYRTTHLTAEAVASVLTEPEVEEVRVVDNASGDGSVERLTARFQDARVEILSSQRNVGFGAGVNLGAARCRSPLLLVLNSDATVVPGAVATLAKALVADDGTGVVAPAVYQHDGRTLQPGAYGRLPARRDILSSNGWVRRRGADDAALAVRPGWVSGVAMLLRRADFIGLGGFDESFAMYLEDVDLCRRLAEAGKSVRRVPSAAVVHHGGRSWTDPGEARRRFHRSKLRYYEKLGVSRLELQCVRLVGAVRGGRAPRQAG